MSIGYQSHDSVWYGNPTITRTTPRKCRICGCTDNRACMSSRGPCYWVEPDLCSGCVVTASVLESIDAGARKALRGAGL